MRVALFDHVQRLPISFFTRTQTGSLPVRLNNDVIGAQQAVTSTLGTVVSNIITLVVTLTVMLGLEWRLTILTLIVLPAFIIPARRIGRRLQSVTREGFQLDASMNNTIAERFNVSGALVVKLFGNHDRERDHFADRAARVRDIGVTSAMYSPGALRRARVRRRGRDRGRLLRRWDAGDRRRDLDRHRRRVRDLRRPDLPAAHPAHERPGRRDDRAGELRAGLRGARLPGPRRPSGPAPSTSSTPSAASSSTTCGSVIRPARVASLTSLEEGLPGVDATTSPSAWILRDVSLTIEPGELVAIVGPSGAGKTTTAMLVPRIADVVEGAVRIDGHDVRDLTLDSLRDAVGFVMQDPHLFHDTIRENLRYARPDATDDELVAACRAARIHDLDRIAARRLRHDRRRARLPAVRRREATRRHRPRAARRSPSIVILDEATSHLDSESELAIQRALTAALAGRTALVIAHRLSTIVNADRIIVIDDGRIVEEGTHDDLLDRGRALRGPLPHPAGPVPGRRPATSAAGAGRCGRRSDPARRPRDRLTALGDGLPVPSGTPNPPLRAPLLAMAEPESGPSTSRRSTAAQRQRRHLRRRILGTIGVAALVVLAALWFSDTLRIPTDGPSFANGAEPDKTAHRRRQARRGHDRADRTARSIRSSPLQALDRRRLARRGARSRRSAR